MNARRRLPVVLLACVFAAFGCGVDGGGGPIPPLASDFAEGATIPGWVLRLPDGGRADVQARSSHENGTWTVILSRPLRTAPKDTHFALAVFDDGKNHSGLPLVRFTADPAAAPGPTTIVSRRVPNGQIVPDGTIGPGEYPPGPFSMLSLTPQNALPAGRYPAPLPLTVLASSAYDDVYVHFVFRWTDPSGTRSDLGPLLQWNGTGWVPRPHRANDLDGNGVLGPAEPQTFTAEAEDEDRLAMFFPVRDQESAYVPGGMGCASSCHPNPGLDPEGTHALHALSVAGDLVDVWEWRAAATGPARAADDLVLRAAMAALGLPAGKGLSADAGESAFVAQDPAAPALMFVSPPQGHEPLIAASIDFNQRTEPGWPVLPPVMAQSSPYDPLDFNHTGSPPNVWTGQPPLFGNDFLPPFAQQPPSGSRGDLEAVGRFDNGTWTVEIRRRRVTREGTGAARPDDVVFDDDADFWRRAYQATSAGSGLPFSISLVDRGRGHGQGESLHAGPILLHGDASVTGILTQQLVIHDYGAGFDPTSAADFIDARETRPAPSGGPDVGLALKAGTDGGTRLYILARWSDPDPDTGRDRWTWNGFFWERAGEEDELRLLFDHTLPPAAFATSGCATLCHTAPLCPTAPAGATFASPSPTGIADLWHWRAGRGAMVGFADDGTVDGRCEELVPGSSGSAHVHGDPGMAAFLPNLDPAHDLPRFMAPNDPNANAPVLTMGVPMMPDAIPFLDVAAGLPPGGPGGGGGEVSFMMEVLPIFMARCTQCHPPNGGLDLTSHAGVLAGGNSGPAVIPGNAGQSRLIQRITGAVPPQMPLGGPPLTSQQIATISTWIDEGAMNN